MKLNYKASIGSKVRLNPILAVLNLTFFSYSIQAFVSSESCSDEPEFSNSVNFFDGPTVFDTFLGKRVPCDKRGIVVTSKSMMTIEQMNVDLLLEIQPWKVTWETYYPGTQ